MLSLTKGPPARSPSLRPAAPNQRAAAKAAPPAAKPRPEAAARRRQLRADVAEALGAPQAPAKAATGSAKRAASSTKVSALAKPSAARKQAALAPKSPVPLPAPRQAPPKVTIRFPRLPGQPRAARYQSAEDQQASLVGFRKFLRVARMIAETRRLSADERHRVEIAKARIEEIKAVAWSGVR